VKVLELPPNSDLIYQKALTKSELKFILTNRTPDIPNEVLATDNVRAVYGILHNPQPRKALADSCCRICYQSFNVKGGEPVYYCHLCGINLHKDCWDKYSLRCSVDKKVPVCIFCKTPNLGIGTNLDAEEGYLNMGSLQGSPKVRDSSTYNPYFFDERRRRF
jgi:hypothetical protein